MSKAIELNICGLKCDKCSYRDDEIPFSDYKKSINKPCPKCGESLLTEKEYKKCVKMYDKVERFNTITYILRWFNPLFYLKKIFVKKSN